MYVHKWYAHTHRHRHLYTVCLYIYINGTHRWRQAMMTGRRPKRKGSPKPPDVSMAPRKPSVSVVVQGKGMWEGVIYRCK